MSPEDRLELHLYRAISKSWKSQTELVAELIAIIRDYEVEKIEEENRKRYE